MENKKMESLCLYNELTGEEPTLNDCDKCHEKFNMPCYWWCCLRECNRHEYCMGCTHGIYELYIMEGRI